MPRGHGRTVLLEGRAHVTQPGSPHGTVTHSRDLSQEFVACSSRTVPGGDALAAMIEVSEVSEGNGPSCPHVSPMTGATACLQPATTFTPAAIPHVRVTWCLLPVLTCD